MNQANDFRSGIDELHFLNAISASPNLLLEAWSP